MMKEKDAICAKTEKCGSGTDCYPFDEICGR